MGGCSVLVLFVLLMSVGAVLLGIFLTALSVFLIATVISVVFAVRAPRRRESGKKLGALLAIPIVLYAISVPVLIYFAIEWIPLVVSGG
ncbi:MAG: hypothetical protein SOU51_01460 [Collinsella sp.]|nr:hypothetical protein [Collinsella sp.]